MPVYVYKNLQTGETFEFRQSIQEPALTAHPETGEPVRRVVQPVGIAFKGSGFYVTDSRKSGSAQPAKDGDAGKSEAKAEGGKADAAKTGSAKTETKAGKETSSSGKATG